MRILLLSSAYDSLTQRAQVELADRGHEISVELAVSDEAMRRGVRVHDPELVIAPMLTSVIPPEIWSARPCLVVHPGPVGDRGPSALDWAIMEGAGRWGVTVRQPAAVPGTGDVWASAGFVLPRCSKDSVYRMEVADAAMTALRLAIARFQDGRFTPQPIDYRGHDVTGRPHGPCRQQDRRIDWHADPTWAVLTKLRAADSSPGVLDTIDGAEYFLIGGYDEDVLRGEPGAIIASRDGAICRATVDGAVWIPELRRRAGQTDAETARVPATMALPPRSMTGAPEAQTPLTLAADRRTYREIRYSETRSVGYLEFSFPGGVMSTAQCGRLLRAFQHAATRPVRVIVLGALRDVFCSGIHTGVAASAKDPVAAERQNAAAMADLVTAILTTTGKLVVAALAGDAAAAGLVLARAADEVWCRDGVVLRGAYQPVSAARAARCGLADRLIIGGAAEFQEQVENLAATVAASPDYQSRLAGKARLLAEASGSGLPADAFEAALVTG